MESAWKKFVRIKKRSFSARALILFAVVGSVVSPGLTLKYDDLPDLIQKKNGAVASSVGGIESSRERTGHLYRSYLPHVDFMAGTEHFKTGPFPADMQPYGGVELSVNIFKGGNDLLEERARTAQVGIAESQREKVLREELSGARDYYWELVFQREYLGVLKEIVELNQQGKKAANRRVSRGIVSKTDVMIFDLYSHQLDEQIESANHEIDLIQLALRPRLGFSEADRIETPSIIPHDHDDTLIKSKPDIASHPEVTGLLSQVAQREAQASQSSRWWTPSVDVYANYSLYTLRERFYPATQDRYDYALGVRLKMHLFDGFDSHQDAQSEHKAAASAEQMAAYRRRTLDTDIRLAQEEMTHIHELVHGAEKFIEQSGKLLKLSLGEYDRGVRTSSDILAMNDRLLTLKKLYLERRRDYQKTKVKLLSLLGK